MTENTPILNYASYSRENLKGLVEKLGEPSYRANQIFQWIHGARVTDFESMTSLSNELRARLAEQAEISWPQLERIDRSTDGTRKLILRLHDGKTIHAVMIPEGERRTLCVSTQVGCSLKCAFCLTGKSGFARNLSVGEIVGQLYVAEEALKDELTHGRMTNIVLMGMGEPLLNCQATVDALRIWTDEEGAGLSPTRITLSTAGVTDQIITVLDAVRVNLAVSLHAATEDLRTTLLPHNKKWPLKDLMTTVRKALPYVRDRVTIEYVLLDGINMGNDQAEALSDILDGIPSKVNLIPFNPHEGSEFTRPSVQDVERFRRRLVELGVDAYVRRPRGDDISAACGQLEMPASSKNTR